MTRDISERQFRREIERRGWRLEWAGCVNMGPVSINRYNAGDRRRSQLAHLIAEGRKHGANVLPLGEQQ